MLRTFVLRWFSQQGQGELPGWSVHVIHGPDPVCHAQSIKDVVLLNFGSGNSSRVIIKGLIACTFLQFCHQNVIICHILASPNTSSHLSIKHHLGVRRTKYNSMALGPCCVTHACKRARNPGVCWQGTCCGWHTSQPPTSLPEREEVRWPATKHQQFISYLAILRHATLPLKGKQGKGMSLTNHKLKSNSDALFPSSLCLISAIVALSLMFLGSFFPLNATFLGTCILHFSQQPCELHFPLCTYMYSSLNGPTLQCLASFMDLHAHSKKLK